MTPQELINKAHEIARKEPGYSYDTWMLEQIIREGIIREGDIIAEAGAPNGCTQRLIREGDFAVCYLLDQALKNPVETKRTLIATNPDGFLIAYAVNKSKVGHSCNPHAPAPGD